MLRFLCISMKIDAWYFIKSRDQSISVCTSTGWWNQNHTVTSNIQHGNVTFCRSIYFLIGLFVDLNRGNRLLHVAQDHVQMVVIGLQKNKDYSFSLLMFISGYSSLLIFLVYSCLFLCIPVYSWIFWPIHVYSYLLQGDP